MLVSYDVIATVAVRDIKQARDFYEQTLGLAPIEAAEETVMTYQSGDSKLLVYQSDFAGGYGATVATWPVTGGIEQIVDGLKANGVTFEHYQDMPNTEVRGDVHVSRDMKVAWFKDPDGNILCLVEEAGSGARH